MRIGGHASIQSGLIRAALEGVGSVDQPGHQAWQKNQGPAK